MVPYKYTAPPAPGTILTPYTADGREIRGGPLPLRPAELAALPTSHDVGVMVYDLGDPAQLAAYRDVLDKIVNGLFRPLGRPPEPTWNPDTKSYHAVLRWTKPFAEVPAHVRARYPNQG